ncbi:hypothetical protein WJX72_011273 [[Myrmecia] bisecta]|uniref:Uncharacterized protein n=1 Tax=[Myrmecia] bisecta TaxID=41462 RepID=A0AAW1QSS5_9CHLO
MPAWGELGGCVFRGALQVDALSERGVFAKGKRDALLLPKAVHVELSFPGETGLHGFDLDVLVGVEPEDYAEWEGLQHVWRRQAPAQAQTSLRAAPERPALVVLGETGLRTSEPVGYTSPTRFIGSEDGSQAAVSAKLRGLGLADSLVGNMGDVSQGDIWQTGLPDPFSVNGEPAGCGGDAGASHFIDYDSPRSLIDSQGGDQNLCARSTLVLLRCCDWRKANLPHSQEHGALGRKLA